MKWYFPHIVQDIAMHYIWYNSLLLSYVMYSVSRAVITHSFIHNGSMYKSDDNDINWDRNIYMVQCLPI